MAVGDPGHYGIAPNVPPMKKAAGTGCVVWGLVGCGVFAVLMVIFVMLGAYGISKRSDVKNAFSGITAMESCSKSLKDVRTALQAYRKDHDNAYPPSLLALVPDYVPDKSAFRCSDGGKDTGREMVYTKPGPKATGDSVVISIRTGEISIISTQKQVLYVRLLNDGSIVSDQEARTLIAPPDNASDSHGP